MYKERLQTCRQKYIWLKWEWPLSGALAGVNAWTKYSAWQTLREMGGKTHTFWFDWGPGRRTGHRRGSVTCTETSPIQSQWRFRSDCLLPSEIGTSWCGRILHSMAFVLFCLCLSKIKRKKRVKYRPLWQLNFFPGHHEPVNRHWPPVKSSSFTKTARQKVPFSWGRVGGIQFHSIGFAERHV